MAYSEIAIPSDGSTMLFTVNFALGYINRDEVTCRANNEVDGSGNPVYRTLTWVSDTQVQVSGTPLAAGLNYVFKRTVEKDTLIVDWEDGNGITEENLNTAQKQGIMIAHEALDVAERSVKMPVGYEAYEFAPGLVAGDVVGVTPSGQLGKVATSTDVADAATNAAQAAASASQAASSASTASIASATAVSSASTASGAATTATNAASDASASATAAAGSASAASGSASAAAGSATSASGSAGTATTKAAEAAASATAAANSATSAGTSASNASTSASAAAASAAVLDGIATNGAVAQAVDLAALKALDTTKVKSAYVMDSYRRGIFVWKTGNFSSQITNDTTQAIYVKANAIAATAGAWVRSDAEQEWLPYWFGAVLDGVTDDTAAFQAAYDLMSTGGAGSLRIPSGASVRINGTLTVRKRCTLRGNNINTGSPGNNTTSLYTSYQHVKLGASGKIVLESGAGLAGLVIVPFDAVWPATADSKTAKPDNWTGTAIEIGGEDTLIEHCTILCFDKALYSTGHQRIRIDQCNIDCKSGIDIRSCYDICYLTRIHCWPFATIAASAAAVSGASISRPGTAFNFQDGGDWNKLTDCFSYGYVLGFVVNSCNSMTLLNCSSDNISPTPLAGSIGFVISGTSLDTRLIGCQSAASRIGVFVSAAGVTRISNHNAWVNADHAILVGSGATQVSILDSTLRNAGNGVSCDNASSKVEISRVRFEAIAGNTFNCTVSNTNWTIKDIVYPSTPDKLAANVGVKTIASADPLVLPSDGEVFVVTGTTSFGSIKGGLYPGRRITLVFATTGLTMYHGSGSYSMQLTGGVNINVPGSRNYAITLVTDGDRWFACGSS